MGDTQPDADLGSRRAGQHNNSNHNCWVQQRQRQRQRQWPCEQQRPRQQQRRFQWQQWGPAAARRYTSGVWRCHGSSRPRAGCYAGLDVRFRRRRLRASLRHIHARCTAIHTCTAHSQARYCANRGPRIKPDGQESAQGCEVTSHAVPSAPVAAVCSICCGKDRCSRTCCIPRVQHC
jgi:hypothetical protein